MRTQNFVHLNVHSHYSINELAYAERFQIPCHIFYNKNRTSLSAMLAGNSFYNIQPYEDETEIYSIIDSILQKE